MKLLAPIENFVWTENISQLYGVNVALYKRQFGLDTGHNGLDIIKKDNKFGYGTKILSAHTHPAKVTKVFSDFPNKTKGTGVYLHEQLANGEILETVYWHLSDVSIRLGDIVEPHQPIGTPAILNKAVGLMGNTGFVFPKPSSQFPYRGTHLHFAVSLYKNGKRISLDPTPFLFNTGDRLPIKFTRTLTFGSTGDEVSWLQTCLKLIGFAEDYEPVAYFGPKTLRDVRKLQASRGWSPAWVVGPKTREYLNSKYSYRYRLGGML